VDTRGVRHTRNDSTHTRTHTQTHTCTHVHTCALHTHMHTHTHMLIHMRMSTRHACTHTCTRTHTDAARKHTHTHTHTRANTSVHTRTRALVPRLCCGHGAGAWSDQWPRHGRLPESGKSSKTMMRSLPCVSPILGFENWPRPRRVDITVCKLLVAALSGRRRRRGHEAGPQPDTWLDVTHGRGTAPHAHNKFRTFWLCAEQRATRPLFNTTEVLKTRPASPARPPGPACPIRQPDPAGPTWHGVAGRTEWLDPCLIEVVF